MCGYTKRMSPTWRRTICVYCGSTDVDCEWDLVVKIKAEISTVHRFSTWWNCFKLEKKGKIWKKNLIVVEIVYFTGQSSVKKHHIERAEKSLIPKWTCHFLHVIPWVFEPVEVLKNGSIPIHWCGLSGEWEWFKKNWKIAELLNFKTYADEWPHLVVASTQFHTLFTWLIYALNLHWFRKENELIRRALNNWTWHSFCHSLTDILNGLVLQNVCRLCSTNVV